MSRFIAGAGGSKIGILLLTVLGAQAQSRPTPSLITSAVNESRLAVLRGNMHPHALPQFDKGSAPANLEMNRMLLVLRRSPEQDAALTKFLDDVQNPQSGQFHHFLSPDEFGQQFGASEADIQTITGWLTSHAFQIGSVSRGRGMIEFSGTAGQVQRAFHTAIHRFVVDSTLYWANTSEPQIPIALAPAVAGFASLHNFPFKPQSQRSNEQFEPLSRPNLARPLYTSSSGAHALAPADFNTIYGVNKLAGITGAGTTIAVVGRTNINVQDITRFKQVFGLPVNPPNIILNGVDPGDLGGGEEAEAVLDTSWAGAVAPGATVDLVVSASTSSTDGVLLSEAYIINHNLADVMTESFGTCETGYTAAGAQAISNLAAQAAAQGISYVVSSGDSGSAGCDLSNQTRAAHPISVNILGSSPYTLTVGGTQFNENGSSMYWNSGNASTLGSATQYIPEEVWNANCSGNSCGSGSILATGGGASTLFSKPAWQTGVAGIPNDGVRDVPDISLNAAGHDPYLICLAGSCTANGSGQFILDAVYGTSASAPSFAGILALVKQKTGARLGQPAPILYRMAAAENLANCNASNAATPLGTDCIFNDITVGTNAVPGETNYNTSSETYNAGVGFDLATGLGSVNAGNLVTYWGASAGSGQGGATVSYKGVDATTLGNWSGTYGADGQVIPNALTNLPAYASVSFGGANLYTWAVNSSDPRALQTAPGSANRIASTYWAYDNFTISVSLTDGNTHRLALYLCDFDNAGRTQTISILDASTHAVLSTQSFASFSGGQYAVWNVKGNVLIQLVQTGPVNAIVSAVFLDSNAGGTQTAAAAYVSTDASTLGNWSGVYGSSGPIIANALVNPPAYAAVGFNAANTYTWDGNSADPRATQIAFGSGTRIASTYWAYDNLTVNLNLTDGNTHRLALYLCDFDHGGRSQTISILDASTHSVLSTQSFASFGGGEYAVWNVRGNVLIQIVQTGPVNAILNGLFFD